MGTSLASVQVYLGDREREATRELVIEALRQRALQGPYVETGRDTDPLPDREVFVGQLGTAPWLTVFDTQGDLRELARDVSAAIEGTAVFVRLIDSDIIHLRRYSQGEMVDDYCNAPEMYDAYGGGTPWDSDWPAEGEEELKALTRGDLARWRDLFVEGADAGKLRGVWDSDPVFADDILWATADALAMDPDELDAESGVQGGTRLTFRSTQPSPLLMKAEGPPRLRIGAYSSPREVFQGQALDLQIGLRNEGGAATGVLVVAWGSAIEQGIVAPERCVAAPGADPSDRMEAAFAPDVGIAGEERRAVHVARLPALELPQGVAGGLEAMVQPGVNLTEAIQVLAQSSLTLYAKCTVTGTGTGELFIGFAPLDNLEGGQAVYQASLVSLPLPRRPLRCPPSEQAARASVLQQLEQPGQLFAVVVLGASWEQSGKAAAEAIEAWVARVTHKKGDRLKAYLGTRPDLRPKLLRFSAGEIPAGERWQEVRRELGHCISLSIQHGAAGILYERGVLGLIPGDHAPHLGFWFDATAMDAAELDAIAAWLPGVAERLMVQGEGLQAIVGRWNWWHTQGTPGALHETPYEVACGVHGQCTTLRSWCSRFLRGVTGQLWLGPDLLAHLGGAAGLAPIATVTPVGESVRVTLNEGATLDQLEEALAPLLPGEADWREGIDRLYGRPSRP